MRPRERQEPPRFVEKLTTMKTEEGAGVSFGVRAVGDPAPNLTWLKDGRELDEDGNLSISYDGRGGSAVTVLRSAAGAHDGWYQCTAYNRAGAATTRGRLAVRRPELPPQPRAAPVQLHLPRERRVIEPE